MTPESTGESPTPLDEDRRLSVGCYASFWGKLLRKWDRWIYSRAVHSLRRMTLDNPGISYMMELNLRGWNEQLKISQEIKRATEEFHADLYPTVIETFGAKHSLPNDEPIHLEPKP